MKKLAEHPSNSEEQQSAGQELINALSLELGIKLKSQNITLGTCSVQIDGYSENPPVLCEAWAHIGKPKGSQPDKIMTDVLKMLFCEKRLGRKFQKILLFSDEVAKKHFESANWYSSCLQDFLIELRLISLNEELSQKINQAQKRQYR